MSHCCKKFILPFALLCLFVFGGCYTRMMSYYGETPTSGTPRAESGILDDSGCEAECPAEVAPLVNRREICIWERNIFGYPELRCYNTNHSTGWVYFHNTPWWYRDRFHYYGHHHYHRCPPHYYFDRISGICRYYDRGPSRPGGGGSGSAEVELPPRRSARIAPTPADAPPPAPMDAPPMFPSGVKQLSPVATPATPPPPPSSGTQDSGSPPKESEPQTPPRRSARTAPPAETPPPPPDERRSNDEQQQDRPVRRGGRGI